MTTERPPRAGTSSAKARQGLASKLGQMIVDKINSLHVPQLVYGTVSAVSSTAPTVSVTLQGTSTVIPNVKYLDSSTPQVGSTVVCARVGTDLFVMGRITPAIGQSASVLIQKQVLGVAAPTVTFSSIPQNFSHLRIVAQARSAVAAIGDNLCFQFNGDTGANYDEQWASASGNAVNALAGQAFAQGRGILTNISGGNNTAAEGGLCIADIPNYSATHFRKQTLGSGGYADSNGVAADSLILPIVAKWRSAAAITSITLLTGTSSNFVIGSAFWLYGIN